MIHNHEYSREEDQYIDAIYNNVRPGGPKETRLRHSFLEGKLEPRVIYYIKITSDGDNVTSKLKIRDVVTHFEEQGKQVAEAYIPLNSKTKEPWDFFVLGFYKHTDLEEVENIHSQAISNVNVVIDHVDGWFVDIYPNPNQRRGSLSASNRSV